MISLVWGTEYSSERFIRQLYRTVQYFSRFLAWFLLSRGKKVEAARWTALKGHLGIGRKRKACPWLHDQT